MLVDDDAGVAEVAEGVDDTVAADDIMEQAGRVSLKGGGRAGTGALGFR